jgi:hypothetical protein
MSPYMTESQIARLIATLVKENLVTTDHSNRVSGVAPTLVSPSLIS